MPLPTFTTKTDLVDIIYANDVNELQNEVAPTAAASGHVRYSTSYTSTDNVTLTDASMPVQSINFSSNSSITLPAISTANHPFYLINRSTASVVAIIFSGSTLTKLSPGYSATMYSDSTSAWNLGASPLSALAFGALIASLTQDVTPNPFADLVPTYDASAGTAKYVIAAEIGSPLIEGSVKNAKLTVSVASNNITVALKTLSGNDASANEPIKAVVGGTERELTSSLSIGLNAGVDYWGGATKFATFARQFFTYLTWVSSSSALSLGFSPFPYLRTYADGSGTNTNEKYFPNSTTPASTDVCINIGRFTATISSSTSFNWSITGTGDVYNYPKYDTDWLTYEPSPTGFSAVPTSNYYQYFIDKKNVEVEFRSGSDGTSNANTFSLSSPFTAATISNAVWIGVGSAVDNSTSVATTARLAIATAGTSITVLPNFSFTSAWSTSGGKRLSGSWIKYPLST